MDKNQETVKDYKNIETFKDYKESLDIPPNSIKKVSYDSFNTSQLNQTNLDQFGRPYPLDVSEGGALVPRTAADNIVIRAMGGFEILLITRKKPGPSQGKLAFPGGHIDYNEDPMVAAVRELEEECGVKGAEPELFTVRGAPERDDRYHIISMFYLVKLTDAA